jgi:hypothetical protein
MSGRLRLWPKHNNGGLASAGAIGGGRRIRDRHTPSRLDCGQIIRPIYSTRAQTSNPNQKKLVRWTNPDPPFSSVGLAGSGVPPVLAGVTLVQSIVCPTPPTFVRLSLYLCRLPIKVPRYIPTYLPTYLPTRYTSCWKPAPV